MSDMALPSSYLDFNALAQLRGEAAHDPNKAARKTAEQFESYFLQQMMKEMRATVEKSDLVGSNAMDTYQDMMDKEVASKMAERGQIRGGGCRSGKDAGAFALYAALLNGQYAMVGFRATRPVCDGADS